MSRECDHVDAAEMASVDAPEQLYHYTSVEGVIGILSGSIRATMIQYMNDAVEFRYALKLAREIIAEEVAALELDGDSQALCEEYVDTLRNLTVFAFCLSEERDLLSQWRGYCPPEGGYAIGFHRQALAEMMRSEGFTLVKCLYDRGAQIESLRPLVIEMVAAASDTQTGRKDLHQAFTERLARVGAAIKDESFREEREWRLVWFPGPSDWIKYRTHRNVVVPYCDWPNTERLQLPFSEVVLGPHRDPELARRALHHMTATAHGWPIRVGFSTSTFRLLG